MASPYFDRLVGIRKVKRAEETLLGRPSGDLSALERSELLEYAWALSTMLVAAEQGVRLAPEVFVLAESLAHSRNAIHQPSRGNIPAATSDGEAAKCIHGHLALLS